jgi:beta-N-acetylhexosaminidase
VHRISFVLSTVVVSLSLALGACAPRRAPEAVLPRDPIGYALDSLPLRDRIAQLVIPWIGGNYQAFDDAAFQQAVRWVDSLHVGGIIVSIGSPLDIAAKLNHLQRRSFLPLLMTSDLESGTSFRFVGGTPFPPNMGVAAGRRELDAYEVGRVTALEGRAVGVHVTFAPSADVNNNPANPIINTRSFGADPGLVATMVAAAVRGIQEHDMLATAKHFPGHGDTETDSHLALPVVQADWARLDSLELVPFRAAVDADVGMIMSAHIALPALDGGQVRPGTVQPQILTGLVRDSLGFDGIVVTDALNMAGLVSSYGPGEAAVLAFLAGADILLQPADAKVTIDAMEAAVRQGRISEERLERSLRRVLELKRDLGLFERRTVALDSVPAVVGGAEFQEIARDIAERSIVLARDDEGLVDSLRRRPQAVTLVTYADEGSGSTGSALASELRRAGHRVSTFRLTPASGPASYDSARAALRSASTAVFAAAVRAVAWKGTIGLPPAVGQLIDATACERPTVLVSLGSPYVITGLDHVRSYVVGWAANPISERAAGRALTGAAVTGLLPIAIPPDLPYGAGVQLPALADSTEAAR